MTNKCFRYENLWYELDDHEMKNAHVNSLEDIYEEMWRSGLGVARNEWIELRSEGRTCGGRFAWSRDSDRCCCCWPQRIWFCSQTGLREGRNHAGSSGEWNWQVSKMNSDPGRKLCNW